MALFGGLFDKKVCSICGGDAGRVFTKKLEDGVLCKECAGKLSPFFSDRRASTVEQIQQQLAYREANKAEVEKFNVTRTLGGGKTVMLDEDARKFIVVSNASNWRSTNPDVIDFSRVTGVDIDVDESRSEDKYRDDEGNYKSYDPPRYTYDYDFDITIRVNHDWFDTINYQVNTNSIDNRYSAEYREAERKANEIKDALTAAREEGRNAAAAAAAAAAPKGPVICPYCGATTTPTATNCCEYCGGPLS